MSAPIDVVMPSGELEDWTERHSRGDVPSRWPYGLDLMQSPSTDVTLRFLDPPKTPARVRATLPKRWRPAQKAGLAWDENTAHRMVLSRRYREMHCGVIWATENTHEVSSGLRRSLSRMTSVWTLSRAQLDALDDLVPARVRRRFVQFGVDEDFFGFAAYPERPTILSVGRDRHRDFPTLLDAFAIVKSSRPGVRAVVQTPRDVIAPTGIEVLPFLGHAELREMYRQSSVVAIATRPNLHVSGMTVALEAQSVGRPVVLTRTPGAEDYVSDSVTGHLTGGGDSREMAARIIDILDDAAAAITMGQLGRSAVAAGLTTKHLAARLRETIST